jgi:polyvinyl alcohol dehydrogenase (cytochrome)
MGDRITTIEPRRPRRLALILMLLGFCGAGLAKAAPDPVMLAAGSRIYAERCAQCHDNPQGRAPARYALQRLRSADFIVAALTGGLMQSQAQGLTAAEIATVATFLTGQMPGTSHDPDPDANRCKDSTRPLGPSRAAWNGWSPDLGNARYQPEPGLTPRQVPRLRVKWVFAYPDGGIAGQPTVVDGLVYITSRTGRVFALDARTGCTAWSVDARVSVRTAVIVGPMAGGRRTAYFGDEKGIVHAVDAASGLPLWMSQVDAHPVLRVGGSLALFDGMLYVPTSSLEEAAAADPHYSCCSFRGSLSALDAETGTVRWKSYTVAQTPQPLKVNAAGTQMYGPAGGAIWSTPTVDPRRGLVYVGTGDSYTDVPSDSTDALLAFDLKTGARRWTRQVLASDAWLAGCDIKRHANCPETLGPDHDFGSSPILHTMPGGRQILLEASKSGMIYGFDPDAEGRILWRTRVGHGGIAGGVMFGPAADAANVYVAISDDNPNTPNAQQGGLAALKIATGEKIWVTSSPEVTCGEGASTCSKAQSAAVTAMPGIVFSGTKDGHIRAYQSTTGRIVWDFDTARSFPAVNAKEARGGGIDGGAQAVAGGMLFVNSGAARVYPGNALIAFTVDGK